MRVAARRCCRWSSSSGAPLEFGEPGVFIAFEETEAELAQNVASLGFDVEAARRRRSKLAFDHVHVERAAKSRRPASTTSRACSCDWGYAIDSVGARRVVLDTIESLFSGFSDDAVLRAELRRLFGWLKDRGVTAVITGERGDGTLTRQGLEEYVSDCVILLDHRVLDQVSTRRLRVVKYRGTSHGTNEYPFLIDEYGITVLPVTSLGLRAQGEPTSASRPAIAAPRRDARRPRILPWLVDPRLGDGGSGKTSLAAHFAAAVCARGERCLYLAFEESPDQIVRNMRSIGVDLAEPMAKGLLRIEAARPTYHGLEMHLSLIHRLVERVRPARDRDRPDQQSSRLPALRAM